MTMPRRVRDWGMDWYRTPDWSLDDQEHFELKLRRAHQENRGQYLRIKGLSLESAGLTDAARSLFVRAAVEAGKDPFEKSTAWENLADSVKLDDPELSERLLRRILEINPTLNFTTGMAEVHLADRLLRRRTPEALDEARELLDAWDERGEGRFSSQLFEAAVARARWCEATGDAAGASEWAAHALELAEIESPLANAPGLAVQDLDRDLADWLTRVASSSDTPRARQRNASTCNSDDRFWETIDSASTAGRLDVDALTALLTARGVRAAGRFHRELGHLLVDLDRQDLHDVYAGSTGAPLVSPDGFLHWRAGVIAAGREVYERALRGESDDLATLEECEDLLHAASEASDRDFHFDEDVESGSTLRHWPMLRACAVEEDSPDDDDELRFHWITLTVEDVTEPPLPPEEQWGEDFHRHPTPEDIDFVAQNSRANLAGALTEGLGRSSAPSPGPTILVELDEEAEAPRLALVHNSFDPTFREPGVLVRLRREDVIPLDDAGVDDVFTVVLLDALDLVLPEGSPLRDRLRRMIEEHRATAEPASLRRDSDQEQIPTS
ncbi:hypothetical protein GCM10028787_09010 [Brachybacterium horti]